MLPIEKHKLELELGLLKSIKFEVNYDTFYDDGRIYILVQSCKHSEFGLYCNVYFRGPEYYSTEGCFCTVDNGVWNPLDRYELGKKFNLFKEMLINYAYTVKDSEDTIRQQYLVCPENETLFLIGFNNPDCEHESIIDVFGKEHNTCMHTLGFIERDIAFKINDMMIFFDNFLSADGLGPDKLDTYVSFDELRKLRHLSEQGNLDAEFRLAYLNLNGAIVSVIKGQLGNLSKMMKGNEQDSIKTIISLADRGYALAQYCVGLWYYNGEFVSKNQEMGIFYLTNAAKQGFQEAQNFLMNNLNIHIDSKPVSNKLRIINILKK